MTEGLLYNGYELQKNQIFIPEDDITVELNIDRKIKPEERSSLLLQAKRETLTNTGLYGTIRFVQEQSEGIGRGAGKTGRYGFIVTLKPQPQETPAQ